MLQLSFTFINLGFLSYSFISLARGLSILLSFKENIFFWLVLYIEGLLVFVLLSPALIVIFFVVVCLTATGSDFLFF